MAQSPSVLITGASSGIGHALALALAAPGSVLHLSGRDPGRLADVAEACQTRGAIVHPALVDVRDAPEMAEWVGGAGRLDLVVACAGVSAGGGDRAPEPLDQTRPLFDTNLGGVLNTVLPAVEAMRQQLPAADGVRGRIAVIASMAAFVPAPSSAAYCASKAAVDTWTVAAAPGLRRAGVHLTSVCPGYIRTPMTARNRFSMPGLMDAERAAAIILRGIAADRTRIMFPWWMGVAARLAGLLPARLTARLVGM